MTRNNQQIEALIFDLGGVLINLNVQHTLEAFSRLSAKKHEEIVALYQQHNLFHSYEKGLISDEDFREGVRDLLQIQAEDHTLDDAWNAMIKDFPQGRLEVLRKLGEDYRLFLLSNTNNIHLKCVRKVFEPIKQETLEDYFEEAYYSHLIGMRKPDHEIYQEVLHRNDLNPAQTLFLDDNQLNLQGADAVGIQTFWVQQPDQWKEIFNAEKA